MNNLYDLIKKPIITKKSIILSQINQLSFQVANKSTKTDLKKAFSVIFNVNVKKIRTLITRGKNKRVNKYYGKRKNIKKAILTMKNSDDVNKLTMFDK